MFKRVFISLVIGLILFTLFINNSNIISNTSTTPLTPFEVYLFKNSSCAKIDKSSSELSLRTILNKRGESFILNNNTDIDEFLATLDAKLVFTERCNDGISFYAYSSQIRCRKRIDNKVINMQIFIGQEKTVVGFPMIFGSF